MIIMHFNSQYDAEHETSQSECENCEDGNETEKDKVCTEAQSHLSSRSLILQFLTDFYLHYTPKVHFVTIAYCHYIFFE